MRERVASISRHFLTVFINTVLEDWGQIHLLFACRLLGQVWGGGGGAVGLFKGGIEVPHFLSGAAIVSIGTVQRSSSC